MRNISHAKAAQAKHWETLGQLYRIKNLASYILTNKYLDPYVKHKLQIIITQASEALSKERRNNEFINLKIQPKWKAK